MDLVGCTQPQCWKLNLWKIFLRNFSTNLIFVAAHFRTNIILAET